MTRGILIAGNEAPLTNAFAAEAAKRLDALAVALAPSRFAEVLRENSEPPPGPRAVPPAEGSALIPLAWNPAGSVSARSLVVAAENRLGRLDEAILVCTPASFRKRADELAPAEIDCLVDDQIKGWFFLVRELTLLFRSRKSGSLSLVLSEAGGLAGKDESVDLVGPSVAASFRALAQGLLAASFAEPYRVLGFSSSEAGEDGPFAAFAFKIMDEGSRRDAGKWHKYGKLGFFGR